MPPSLKFIQEIYYQSILLAFIRDNEAIYVQMILLCGWTIPISKMCYMCLLWWSTSIVELTQNQTWQSWLLTLFTAVTRVYERSERAGGSGPWELRPLRE